MKADQTKNISELLLKIKNKCHEKDKKTAENFGITYPEFNCMSLFFSKDQFLVKELAEKLCLTSGGVTRIVSNLEKDGYVIREMAPHDRRGVVVSMTDKGKILVQKLQDDSREYCHSVLSNIPQTDHAMLLRSMELLLKALKKRD